jgi:bacillithiol biosynthesis deacetylase BshB1
MPKFDYDLIAIGPHPDDVEVGCAGVLIDAASRGKKAGIIILTQGEMGTGGTPDLRAQELKEAASIMGVDIIASLNWGDTKLFDTYERRLELGALIRKTRPHIILTPYPHVGHGRAQSHPDHVACGEITVNAAFLSSLKKADIHGEPYQPHRIYHYFLPHGINPTFIVDITPHFDKYIAALSAHRSQFLNPEKQLDYLDLLKARARSYGLQAGCKYGQGFAAIDPVVIKDITSIAQRWDWD